MTSSYGEPARTRLSAAVVVVAAMAAMAVFSAMACGKQSIFPTYAEFTRNGDAGCSGPNNSPPGEMDTYVVEMYEVKDLMVKAATTPRSSDCEACIANGPTACSREKETCVCSGPVTATPENLRNALVEAGARFTGLDVGDVYCLRVLALRQGTVGARAAGACQCEDQLWLPPVELEASAQMCAISQQRDIGPHVIQLDLRCPNDVFNRGGFGGGQNNTFTFEQCIFPNPADRPDGGAGGG